MKLFIRQSFTQADGSQSKLVQKVLNAIKKEYRHVEFLTGSTALCSESFRDHFEDSAGVEFTPTAFREYRLDLIDQCDAIVVIRTSMSESGAFELSYNFHNKNPKPVFYALWKKAPIKTTLLRELDSHYPVVYCEFEQAEEIINRFREFTAQYNLLKEEHFH